jgi:hypothetical protein
MVEENKNEEDFQTIPTENEEDIENYNLQIQSEEKTISSFNLNIFELLVALFMLMIAFVLDLASFALFILSFFGIGIPLSFVLDIIGALTIGIWYFWRHKKFLALQKNFFQKLIFNKVNLKFFSFLGLESIPFLGDFLTSWTILVCWEIINMLFFE